MPNLDIFFHIQVICKANIQILCICFIFSSFILQESSHKAEGTQRYLHTLLQVNALSNRFPQQLTFTDTQEAIGLFLLRILKF
jgi:hypothetical protein